MSLRQAWFFLQRRLTGFGRVGHERFLVGVLEFLPVSFAQTWLRACEPSVFFESVTKYADGVIDILFFVVILQIAEAAQIEIVGSGFGGAVRRQCFLFLG